MRYILSLNRDMRHIRIEVCLFHRTPVVTSHKIHASLCSVFTLHVYLRAIRVSVGRRRAIYFIGRRHGKGFAFIMTSVHILLVCAKLSAALGVSPF